MGSAANACARVSAMRAGFGLLSVPAAVLVAVLVSGTGRNASGMCTCDSGTLR